jgi:hypothetical protein
MGNALLGLVISVLMAGPRLNMPRGWSWPPSKRMKEQGKECLAALTRHGIKWEKAPSMGRITTPIYVPSMELGGVKMTAIWKKGPHPMDCHFAQAMIEYGGPALRTAGVREVRFAGIYDYRFVSGKRGVLSRHALGLAMDVYEFVTDDGLIHIVKSDYNAGDEVLREVERAINGSNGYRMLLTPGNDPRHHDDHFHFEARTPEERVETPPLRSERPSL